VIVGKEVILVSDRAMPPYPAQCCHLLWY